MLNLLTKTKPWIVASLLVATSVFGQNANDRPRNGNAPCPKPCPAPECKPKSCPVPCPQPCPPTQLCPPACPAPCCPAWPVPVLNAAYNYPARTMTRCPWDVYFDVSFIYWQASQENMELGFVNRTPFATIDTAGGPGLDASVLNMSFKYKPGFKVGLGGNFDYDNWDIHAEYTWFHNRNSVSTEAPALSAPFTGLGQIFPGVGVVGATAGTGTGAAGAYSSASQSWRLGMDLLDLDMGRWYYVGTKLTFRPSVGARAAFISQRVNTTFDNASLVAPLAVTANILTVTSQQKSWAVGPTVALDTNWIIGEGFRLFGNASGDILFTKYTRLKMNQTNSAATLRPAYVKQSAVGTLRTHLDIQTGLGWGTYIDCNNWYLDFAAGYEFQVFFDQNMFRSFSNDVSRGRSLNPNGNLYIQGLTLTARLDF